LDRTGDNVLPLPQEFLTIMLGAQRTSVTMAAQSLHRKGMIDFRRGRITVLDSAAMDHTLCECFRTIEAVFSGVFTNALLSTQAS
jgi:hypothetical protein